MLQLGSERDNLSDLNDKTRSETNSGVKHQAVQLYGLFQIMFYELHNGSKKTPLHMMTAHSIYDKCKSRDDYIYKPNQRIHQLCQFVEKPKFAVCLCCAANSTPIPSHFNSTDFTIGALDNFHFEDDSSLSGMAGTHDTVMVLFQDCSGEAPPGKPNVSVAKLKKRRCKLTSELMCQHVGHHRKPVNQPSLSETFKVAEDVGLQPSDTASCKTADKEFLITPVKCGLPSGDKGQVPPWGGFHALISQSTSVISSPVTNYASVLSHEKLRYISLPCQSSVMKVFVLSNPEEFEDLFPMVGMFHMAKVALHCVGKYIGGSGMDAALIRV
ncbi:hypothetical protein EOD39_11470 [Acipenser ruthenus]|uniref:Uncharacterized protein n=1 Tax=Acipenser ruthenus TaxID=7906 RepID=A0A662YS94_ACIRT|nr:hypothetical protein EOD39_11470 [Acipenser ruthenus]